MRTSMLGVADDFVNIRGSLKVGGLIDIGTQCSLAPGLRDRTEELAERWRDAENLCAAHTTALTAAQNQLSRSSCVRVSR